MMSDGVAIVGYFTTPDGLGESARRQYKSFRAVNCPVAAYNIPLDKGHLEPIAEFETGIAKYRQAIIHLNPVELMHSGLRHVQPGRHYMIGFWHWELPLLPLGWAAAIDGVDEIWAPSSFIAEMYRFAGKPIRLVPHAVPPNDITKAAARSALGLPHDRFVFLSISDTDSYPARKNPEGAFRAFTDAFNAEADSPLLVVKIRGGSRTPAFGEFIRRMHAHPLVRVVDQTLDEAGIRNLQAACDCFISLHRSEGFGLNLAECMAAGKAVIATHFSGNVDFMNADNSLPIPYSVRLVGRGEYLHSAGQWWAEPSHEAAVEAIRWVAANPTAAAAIGENAKLYMSAHHSFHRIGETAVAALQGGQAFSKPASYPV